MATVNQFLQHLSESGLFSDEELRALSNRLSAMDGSEDAKTLANELIKNNKLTSYQAEAIYQGHPHRLVIGRNYIVEDIIGSGGMGMVFRAKHRRMRRTVALKVLSSHAMHDEEAIRRFYQEVEVAATLDHRNIVRAFDADESQGVHYLVMEFVRGNDLQQIVQREGPLSPGQAVNCALQAAEGLAHAHLINVIHRDIKPANLLLNAEGLVKILDMGLARINNPLGDAESSRPGLTMPGSIMGTVDFMGPEQAADTSKADARSDIYSLGCTLYYLLTGKPVYDGETAMVKLIAHRESPIPSLRDLRPDVSAELDAVFRKMVAKKPEHRYQSMKEVVEALKPCRTESEAETRETVTRYLSPELRESLQEEFDNTQTGKGSGTKVQKAGQFSTVETQSPAAEISSSALDQGDESSHSAPAATVETPTPGNLLDGLFDDEPIAEPPPKPDAGRPQARSNSDIPRPSPVRRFLQTEAGQTVVLLAAALLALCGGLMPFLDSAQRFLALGAAGSVLVLLMIVFYLGVKRLSANPAPQLARGPGPGSSPAAPRHRGPPRPKFPLRNPCTPTSRKRPCMRTSCSTAARLRKVSMPMTTTAPVLQSPPRNRRGRPPHRCR